MGTITTVGLNLRYPIKQMSYYLDYEKHLSKIQEKEVIHEEYKIDLNNITNWCQIPF